MKICKKKLNSIRRKERTRFKLRKSQFRKIRLSFYRSGHHIYSQAVDENDNSTLTSITSCAKEFKILKIKNNIIAAIILGARIASLLVKNKVKNIYFDRGAYKYHGKTKAFVDSARNNGLNF